MKDWLYAAVVPAMVLMPMFASAQTAPAPAPPSAPQVITVPTITRIPPAPLRPMTPLNSFADPSFGQSKYYQQVYELAQNYGRCATNIGPIQARAVLNSAPNTRTELAELRQLTGIARPCLPYNYGVPIVFMRGTLAEALYRRQPIAQTLHAAGTTEQQLQAFQDRERHQGWARLPDDRAFATVSNCLVVRAPSQVRAILMSRVGSLNEREGIKTLLAAAPGCSTSKSFSPVSGTTFIRAYLAESALRWAEFSTQQG